MPNLYEFFRSWFCVCKRPCKPWKFEYSPGLHQFISVCHFVYTGGGLQRKRIKQQILRWMLRTLIASIPHKWLALSTEKLTQSSDRDFPHSLLRARPHKQPHKQTYSNLNVSFPPCLYSPEKKSQEQWPLEQYFSARSTRYGTVLLPGVTDFFVWYWGNVNPGYSDS